MGALKLTIDGIVFFAHSGGVGIGKCLKKTAFKVSGETEEGCKFLRTSLWREPLDFPVLPEDMTILNVEKTKKATSTPTRRPT